MDALTPPAALPPFTGRVVVDADGLDVASRSRLALALAHRGWRFTFLARDRIQEDVRAPGTAVVIIATDGADDRLVSSLAERLGVVTLHAPLSPEAAERSAALGALAAHDVASDPAHWLPTLPRLAHLAVPRPATGRGAARAQPSEDLARVRAISAALGLLAERHALTIDQAFERLREQARSRRETLDRWARAVTAAHHARLVQGTVAATPRAATEATPH